PSGRSTLSSLRERVGLAFRGRRSPAVEGTGGGLSEEEEPLRAELFSVSQLETHARTLAGWHEVGSSRQRGADRLLPRLDENEVVLREAHALVTEPVKSGTRITPAAEWFVDNYA